MLFTDTPVCVKGQKSVYGVARHEEANVSCTVEADPAEVAFRWTFNNSIGESIDILSYNSDGASKSIARYIPRTRLDYGQLYCFAKNSIGVMKEPCVFTIIPTGEIYEIKTFGYILCKVMKILYLKNMLVFVLKKICSAFFN